MTLKEGIEHILTVKPMDGNEIEIWGKLREGGEREEFARVMCAERVRDDFKLLVWVLGYRDLGKFHDKEMGKMGRMKVLESRPIRRLWLWSRGFFKTSLITEAHSVFLVINNPNIRILIVSYSLEVAKKPLGAIRNHFIGNELFRYLFREICPEGNKDGKIEFGTTESLVVRGRTKGLKEPSIMCAGIGTNITGLHFDVMKIDDLVNKDSVTNDTQIQASKDYYSLLRPLFDNVTIPREDVIGTIYHFNDLHSELSENSEFEKSVIPAHDEEGVFNFPERLDKEGWDRLCNDASLSPYDIQRQWLLRPVNPKDAKFKEEWWREYDDLPMGLAEYICVDPASTQKKKSDYTVIERWGIDWEGKHYLLEGIRDKLTSFERIEKLYQVACRSKNLKFIKYEVLGGRHGDLEAFDKRMSEGKKYFTIKETKSTSASKQDRIEQRLAGPFHAGIIYMPKVLNYRSEYDGKVHDFVQEYKLEFLQFPYTEHDDILDCHSQMFEEDLIRGSIEKVAPKNDAFEWWRQKAIERNSVRRSPFVFGNKKHRIEIPYTIGYK
jgi:phage terminase large subunit-like protein